MKELERLRWKFVLYNMLIVTAVIGITFFAAALLLRRNSQQEVNDALLRAADAQRAETLVAVPSVRVPSFAVVVTPDGTAILQDGIYNAFWTQEFLETAIKNGMAGAEERGSLADYHLRYLRVAHPGGMLIAFADTSYEEAMMEGMLLNGGIACGLVWLGFFLLSWFFARWAVRPVEEAVEHQKEFVADASHELKTPLTIITANAELIEDRYGGREPEMDKWLGNVKQECRQMRRLVESLLMLARNDAMKASQAGWKTVDFSDLVTGEALAFDSVFFQLGKTLNYRIQDSVKVKGDPEQLKQAVKILLDNAARYSKAAGETEVILETWKGKWACLWVKSEGNVIPKEQRKAVFRRFYRGDASRSSRDGYGLGLAIARAIVKNHKGALGLECEGEKNCFYLRLKKAPGNEKGSLGGGL